MEYKNRYGDKHIFTPDNEGNLLWEGDFGYSRYSKNEDNEITMVDPSGGPYIGKGDSWFGLTVEGFQPAEGGFLIKTNKDERKRFN